MLHSEAHGLKTVDPSTGFSESAIYYPDAFDSDAKLRFLEYYKSNGLKFNSTCKALGIKRDTVKKHIELDQVFRDAVHEIEDDWKEELEAISKASALNPKNIIERIFHMKCHFPAKYGQEFKTNTPQITINISSDDLNKVKKRTEAIEAEIVRDLESASLENVGSCNKKEST